MRCYIYCVGRGKRAGMKAKVTNQFPAESRVLNCPVNFSGGSVHCLTFYGIAHRLREEHMLFGSQLEILCRVLFVAVVEPGSQTL